MSIDQGINDLIEGGAGAFKFENFGDTALGKVIKGVTQQQTDAQTGQPRTFPSGDPMMQIVVTIELKDGTEAALYFKGGKYEVESGSGRSSLDALRDALGDNQLQEGGTLAKQFTGLGKKTNPAFSAPKLYVCQYEPPAIAVPAEQSLI